MINDATVDKQYILTHGSDFSAIFTAMGQVEEATISGIKLWFESLKQNGYWKVKYNDEWKDLDDVFVSSPYPTEKQTNNQITVEAYAPISQYEGFSSNRRSVFLDDKEYIELSASFKINLEIKCLAQTRTAVMRLGDALFLGFQTKINKYLQQKSIVIPANSIKLPQRVTRTPIVKDTGLYEIVLSIESINCDWVQIVEQDGDVLKNINIISQPE